MRFADNFDKRTACVFDKEKRHTAKRRTLVVSTIVLSALILVFSGAALDATWAQKAKKSIATKSADVRAAEKVVRAFFIAFVAKERTALRRIIVPLPEKDFASLIQGTPPSQTDAKRLKAQISTAPMRTLKPGDDYVTSSGETFVVPQPVAGEERLFLMVENTPHVEVVETSYGWRVDAKPILATRKASQAKKAAKAAKPESVLQSFLVAMVKGDAVTLRELVVPVSAQDYARLAAREAATPQEKEQLILSFTTSPVVAIEPGESFTLPDGTDVTIPKSPPGVQDMYMLTDFMPVPVRLIKMNGKWRVVTKPFIAHPRFGDWEPGDGLGSPVP